MKKRRVVITGLGVVSPVGNEMMLMTHGVISSMESLALL